MHLHVMGGLSEAKSYYFTSLRVCADNHFHEDPVKEKGKVIISITKYETLGCFI